jgi:hypothetical protein
MMYVAVALVSASLGFFVGTLCMLAKIADEELSDDSDWWDY